MNWLVKFVFSRAQPEPKLNFEGSLGRYGYFSKVATASVDIEPGGEGQVFYEGTYWLVQYVYGKTRIFQGQKVGVLERINNTLRIYQIEC